MFSRNGFVRRFRPTNAPMKNEQVIAARWVFPVAGPPLERGLVAIRGGKISAVEPYGTRTPDVDLGNSAIIPGLVNAHTHLDLSGLRGKVPPSPDFIGWLKQIIAHRQAQTPEQIEGDIRLGLDEALRFGTTLIGDITAGGASWNAVSQAPLWSVVFREMIGLSRDRVGQVWREAVDWRRNTPSTPVSRKGWSPHAPYSVHAAIFMEAAASKTPVAIHLAETREELQLLESRTGPFVPFLQELGVWEPESLAPSIDFILKCAAAGQQPPVVFAHGNYLSPDAPIPPNAAIVYCPRTHAAFGHQAHPFRDFLKRGVRVALGTDSLASNPDLDLLAEARFIRERYPDLPGEQLLRMATLSGAEALGWHETTGSLEPGKSADLVAVPLPDVDLDDPYALLFDTSNVTNAPRRTMWRGVWR